jgi:hypothetical protein
VSSTLHYHFDNIIDVYSVARQIIESTDKELKDTLITTPNNRKNCKLHEAEIYRNCNK